MVYVFMCKSSLSQSLVGALWQRSLIQMPGQRVIRVLESLLTVVHLPFLLTLIGGAMGDDVPGILQSTISSNVVKGHHLQLWAWPPLFCNFQCYNIKATKVHHPIIQKAVQELLAQGAIEPFTGNAGFYSNVCMVLTHLGGL